METPLLVPNNEVKLGQAVLSTMLGDLMGTDRGQRFSFSQGHGVFLTVWIVLPPAFVFLPLVGV